MVKLLDKQLLNADFETGVFKVFFASILNLEPTRTRHEFKQPFEMHKLYAVKFVTKQKLNQNLL